MSENIKLEDYFEKEDLESIKLYDYAERNDNKVHRRIKLALFAFVVIAFIPLLFDRHHDFDLVYSSQIFMVLSFGVVAYVIYLIFRFTKETDYRLRKNQKSVKRHAEIMDLASFAVLILAMFVVINAFFFSLTSVAQTNSDSMLDTLNPGDHLIVNHFRVDYERFDIVVTNVQDDTYYVKRIIGLPGETVIYDNQELYIQAPGSTERVRYEEPFAIGDTCESDYCEFVVPENHVFLIGDNRENSIDSREETLGSFPQSALYGKIVLRILPLPDFGRVS